MATIERYARYALGVCAGAICVASGLVHDAVKKAHSEGIVTVLYFHRPSKKLFEKCILWLMRNRYKFISVDELYDILVHKKEASRGAVCLTVDDGYADNLETIIPSCDKYQIPVCFFISTEPVENGVFWWTYVSNSRKKGIAGVPTTEEFKRMPEHERLARVNDLRQRTSLEREAMTKDDLKRISQMPLVTIGGHTVHHVLVDRCSPEQLQFELEESRQALSDWTKREIRYFAYPNGNTSGEEHLVLAKNGYQMAFTTESRFLDVAHCDLFYLPRYGLNDEGSYLENLAKMTGAWQTLLRFVRPRLYIA